MCAPTVGHLDPIMLKIWRVGLMGASSAMEPIALFLGALDQTLAAQTRALV
jgi:aspartate aminotransferase-like enzyme